VLPCKVIGKFSIRTVPNMEPDKVTACVERYLKEEFTKLGSKNKLHIECLHGAKSWVASPNHWNFGM
jgi:Cys-Gly metallodipeptidase DUG1